MRPVCSRLGAAGAVTVIVLGLLALPAAAQEIPYDNYLVGDRALGLGGAFVGLADDASATFHNPAGLALLPTASISTSFWLVALSEHKLRDGWITSEDSVDLAEDKFTSPPLVVTAVAKVGRPDASGLRRHSFGMAILKPLRQVYGYDALTRLEDPDGLRLSAFDINHRDESRWYGGGYAYTRSRRFAIGVSGFLALSRIYHEEIEIHGKSGDVQPSPPGYAVTRHSELDISMRHLILRAGLLWQPVPRWRLGLMLQPPGLGVGGSVHNRELTFDVISDAGGAQDTAIGQIVTKELTPNRPIPWEIRLGATFFPGIRTLITADIAMHGKTGSAKEPVALLSGPDLVRMPRPRLLAMQTTMQPTIRAALGGEIVARGRFPVRGGVLVYRSGLPDIPARSYTYFLSDMNTVGGSFSLGVLMDGEHEVSIGAAYIHSWGTGSGLDQSDPNLASYVAVDTEEVTVLVFISGGKRLAKRLAKKLAKEGKNLLRQGETWILGDDE